MDQPIRILLDRNLRDYALRARPASRTQTVHWGYREHQAEIGGIIGKPLPSGAWLKDQVLCLPTIATLARVGQVALFSCTEIDVEEMSASLPFQNQFGDIFAGVRIDKLPSAVERTHFHQTIDFGKYVSGASTAAFIREFLLRIDEKHLPLIEQHVSLPDFDLDNLRNVGRYREICKGLQTDGHLRDAFHLWTAEAHGLDYFLTADKKFINVMTGSRRIPSPTRPICPSQLLDILDMPRLDPLPLKPGEYRDAIDAFFTEKPPDPKWRTRLRLFYRTARIVWFRLLRGRLRLTQTRRT